MNRPPELYLAEEIAYFTEAEAKMPNGRHLIERPYVPTSLSIFKRISLSLSVLSGKYDVIKFRENEPMESGIVRRKREAKIDARNAAKKARKSEKS